MDTLKCKYADKRSNLKISDSNNNSLLSTPTINGGKNKKKRKNQLQSSV